MKNPLSQRMFTRADIGAIIQHPLGKGLQVCRWSKASSSAVYGRRPSDKSEDEKPSHLALEALVSYLETLPSGEKKPLTIYKYRQKIATQAWNSIRRLARQ